LPHYDFKCLVCGNVQEVKLPITSEVQEMPCEVCGCLAKRQIGKGGYLEFKGEGWYETDYKKKGKK